MAALTAGRAPMLAPRAEEGDTPPSRFDGHLAAQLLARRIVFLGTQVDEVSANRVCAQLLLLSAEDPRHDVVRTGGECGTRVVAPERARGGELCQAARHRPS